MSEDRGTSFIHFQDSNPFQYNQKKAVASRGVTQRHKMPSRKRGKAKARREAKVVRQSADKRMELSLRLLPKPTDRQKLTDELASQLKLAKVELESASPGGQQVVEINQRLLSLERQIVC